MQQTTPKIDTYAVIGNPIAHSKSPLIHTAFAKQTHQKIHYERILAPLEGFSSTVENLIARGYKGVNITVPFKFEAYNICQTHTERAIMAGAANTLSFDNNIITGDNTDGVGLVRDIEQNIGYMIKGKRLLLLGAGGAAQGVLQPLIAAKPSHITIANRNLDKAQAMITQLTSQQKTCAITSQNFASLLDPFDIIINATSVGLSDTTLPIADTLFNSNTLAYDMMYGRETLFMAQARKNGAQVADGLGMLVEQAAEAFYIWRAIRPATHSIMQMIRTSTC